jgi:hypothetical protein
MPNSNSLYFLFILLRKLSEKLLLVSINFRIIHYFHIFHLETIGRKDTKMLKFQSSEDNLM